MLCTGLEFLRNNDGLLRQRPSWGWYHPRSRPVKLVSTDLLLACRFKIRSCLVLPELGRCLCFGLRGNLASERRYENVWAKGVKAHGRACFYCGGFHGLLMAVGWKSYEQHWEARSPVPQGAAPSMGPSLLPSRLVSTRPHRFCISSCPATQPMCVGQRLTHISSYIKGSLSEVGPAIALRLGRS